MEISWVTLDPSQSLSPTHLTGRKEYYVCLLVFYKIKAGSDLKNQQLLERCCYTIPAGWKHEQKNGCDKPFALCLDHFSRTNLLFHPQASVQFTSQTGKATGKKGVRGEKSDLNNQTSNVICFLLQLCCKPHPCDP